MKKANVITSILALAILMPLAVQSEELEEIKETSLEASFNQAEATQALIEEQKLVEPTAAASPIPAKSVVPPWLVPKDAFEGFEACSIVTGMYHLPRPISLQVAVQMLMPCMDAVSRKYHVGVGVGDTIGTGYPPEIHIFVSGDAGDTLPMGSIAYRDLKHSVAIRNGRLLGYRASVKYLGKIVPAIRSRKQIKLSEWEAKLQLEKQLRLRGIFVKIKILESLPPQLLVEFPNHKAFDKAKDLFTKDSTGNFYYGGFQVSMRVPK